MLFKVSLLWPEINLPLQKDQLFLQIESILSSIFVAVACSWCISSPAKASAPVLFSKQRIQDPNKNCLIIPLLPPSPTINIQTKWSCLWYYFNVMINIGSPFQRIKGVLSSSCRQNWTSVDSRGPGIGDWLSSSLLDFWNTFSSISRKHFSGTNESRILNMENSLKINKILQSCDSLLKISLQTDVIPNESM